MTSIGRDELISGGDSTKVNENIEYIKKELDALLDPANEPRIPKRYLVIPLPEKNVDAGPYVIGGSDGTGNETLDRLIQIFDQLDV